MAVLSVEQKSLLPEIYPDQIISERAEVERKTRAMHNLRVFRALMEQVEEMQTEEVDRLTGGMVWRVLAWIRVLPRRREKRYGFFIKIKE